VRVNASREMHRTGGFETDALISAAADGGMPLFLAGATVWMNDGVFSFRAEGPVTTCLAQDGEGMTVRIYAEKTLRTSWNAPERTGRVILNGEIIPGLDGKNLHGSEFSIELPVGESIIEFA